MTAAKPPEWASYYVATRCLPDGRWLGVHRLLYHWTLHIDCNEWGYEDRYCFATREGAFEAMMSWDGQGDVPGPWHRHPKSGRRRNIETGEEWIEF